MEGGEVARRAECVDAGAARDCRADDDHGDDEQEDEQWPPSLPLAATPANGKAGIRPTLWSTAWCAHAAMVAIVPAQFGVGIAAPLTLPARSSLESRCAGRHAQLCARAPVVPVEPR